MFSPKRHSTNCQIGSSGIMPSSSYLMPQTSAPRFTPCLQLDRNNWMSFWMKILRANAYDHQITYGIPCLFHQKEGWEPPFSPGLPKVQCNDCEEHLPPPPDPRYPQ